MSPSLKPYVLLLLLPLIRLTLSSTLAPYTTVTLSGPATPTNTSHSFASDTAFLSSILNSTNTFRHQHNASDVTWNNTLASFASTWATHCKFKHSDGPYGENLASGYENVTAAIDAWGNERKKYDFSDGGFGEDTGHFTQLVWKNTTTVGCARENCDGKGDTDGWFVVCEYWPRGNVKGEYQQMVQKQVEGTSGAAGRKMGTFGVLATAVAVSVVMEIDAWI